MNLAADEIHLWWLDLAASHPVGSSLSSAEHQRAARFAFERDRVRYMRARAGLREILSLYLHCQPADIGFAYCAHGKPIVAGGRLHFNLSHSQELGLLAVARQPVGVDVEWLVPTGDLDAVARQVFTDGEIAEIMSLSEEERVRAFFACWTRKEACLKARGTGLSRDPRSLYVGASLPVASLRLTDEVESLVHGIVAVDNGLVAALATTIKSATIAFKP